MVYIDLVTFGILHWNIIYNYVVSSYVCTYVRVYSYIQKVFGQKSMGWYHAAVNYYRHYHNYYTLAINHTLKLLIWMTYVHSWL